MKKILVIIAALVAIFPAVNSSAQSRFGAVIGADLSSLHFNQDLISVDKSLGFTAGMKSELIIPGVGFGVDASLLYTQRGATLNLGEKKIWASQGYGRERSYLHYLEVPLHLSYRYSKLNGFEDKLLPYLFAGPSFSFLVGHSNIDALKYAGMAASIQVGLGFQLYKKWQVEGCYDLGLTYALKTKLLDNYSARNRTWKLTVTYIFK